MGYHPPLPPIQLNLHRFGLPRDYFTYMWVMYKQRVDDDSPERRAFLHHDIHYDEFLMDYEWK